MIAAATLIVALAGVELTLQATGGPADAAPAVAVQARTPADVRSAVHQLHAVDLEGTVWTLERFRGRVVLIDFWATWCAPCLSELPRLKALRARYPRSEFEILGVMLDAKSRRDAISWLNRNRIDWPQVHERNGYNGALPTAFGVEELPATVLVDADGAIVATGLRGEALASRVQYAVSATAAQRPGAALAAGLKPCATRGAPRRGSAIGLQLTRSATRAIVSQRDRSAALQGCLAARLKPGPAVAAAWQCGHVGEISMEGSHQ